MPHSTAQPPYNTTTSSDILNTITTSLLSSHSLPLSQPWLQSHLPTSTNTTNSSSPPLNSLLKTILFRLLNSDFTTSLTPRSNGSGTWTFPPQTSSPHTQSLTFPANTTIPAQILDIIDVGNSLSSQLEALETLARGEGRRGREIVRVVDVEGAGNNAGTRPTTTTASGGGGGPFKILLSDMQGTHVWGFTVGKVEGIGMPLSAGQGEDAGGYGATTQGMAIGCKVLLHSEIMVWRGIVMLKQENASVLGGKIELLDRAWREGRTERLKREIRRLKEASDAASDGR